MNLDEQIYLRTEQIESKTTDLKEAVRQVAKIENDLFALNAELRELRQKEREQTERQIAEAKNLGVSGKNTRVAPEPPISRQAMNSARTEAGATADTFQQPYPNGRFASVEKGGV